jgi:quaternary ammonium compound-resistance protein SugE
MPWILLVAAGGLEVIWAIGLKESHGFSRLVPSLITIIAMLASFGLLGWAVRDLPMGVAYAVWTGIGTLGVVLVGAFWLGEGLNPLQLFCMLAIVAGIVGLKLMTKT